MMDNMSDNVIDMRNYKMAKVMANDLPLIMKEYKKALVALDMATKSLAPWRLYRSVNLVVNSLHDARFSTLGQLTILQAQLNRVNNVLKFKKT